MADLTTLANVKQWLVISAATNDALLARLLTAASAHVQSWLNRELFSADRVETRDGDGSYRMITRQFPVTAVSALTVDNINIPASVRGSAGYVFNATSIALIGYRFSAGVSNVELSYTAGFVDIPADIQQATVELIGLRYREMDRIGIVSKGLAGETITFSQRDFSSPVRGVLSQYRRVTPV